MMTTFENKKGSFGGAIAKIFAIYAISGTTQQQNIRVKCK